ncbi:MAG TPA: hypothetical protein VHC91_07165 [Trinickia sp.]|nr:hypothetical protein [Trinickia sp.]HVW50173.1 hypothetical protein [Trinickia sp.]
MPALYGAHALHGIVEPHVRHSVDWARGAKRRHRARLAADVPAALIALS